MIQALPNITWRADVFATLAKATTSNNFKVKIGAVIALFSPRSISQYGDVSVVRRSITALYDAYKTMDSSLTEAKFGEHSYKEQLDRAIRDGLAHIKNLGSDLWGQNLEGLQCSGFTDLQAALEERDRPVAPIKMVPLLHD
jgi:hypothetical protein